MKRFLTLALPVLAVLLALSGCGGGEKIDYNLVFVNHSDGVIAAVTVEFQDRGGGSMNADSSPLKRGETFGFEVGEYPATVYVYGRSAREEIGRVTIREAPTERERWYVTARDGAEGLTLDVDTRLPEP